MTENRSRPASPMPLAALAKHLSGSENESDTDSPDDDKKRVPRGEGLTFEGQRFAAPFTDTVVSRLILPWSSGLGSLLTWFFGLLCVYSMRQNWPVWVYVSMSLAWRAMYNVVMGAILHQQSKSFVLTRLMAGLRKDSLAYRICRSIATSNQRRLGVVFESSPPAFNAWLVFRNLADVVLVCDVFYFCGLSVRLYQPLENWWEVLSVVAGCVLVVIGCLAKADAHNIVGAYAWYWGDFFFIRDSELVFGGVFSMFPHPMYTIGYAWYYGLFCISRSPTVLVVGILAQLSQMVFLAVVESPHMDKVYGNEEDNVIDRMAVERGYIEHKEPMFVFNIDIKTSRGVMIVMLLAHTALLHCMGLNEWWYFAHALAWRLAYTGISSYILYRQYKEGWWNNLFVKEGKSKQEAFAHWKAIFNYLLTGTYISFGLCALLRYENPASFFSGWYWACVALASGLFVVQYWSSVSTKEALGSTGWYYGDFFIEGVPFQVTYSGIYRYSNNPDCFTGYASLYAFALLCRDPVLAALALFSQLCHFAFLRFVEMPHVEQLYGKHRREHGALWETIKKNLSRDPSERKKLVSKISGLTRVAREAMVEELRAKVTELVGDIDRMSAWLGAPAVLNGKHNNNNNEDDDEDNEDDGKSASGSRSSKGQKKEAMPTKVKKTPTKKPSSQTDNLGNDNHNDNDHDHGDEEDEEDEAEEVSTRPGSAAKRSSLRERRKMRNTQQMHQLRDTTGAMQSRVSELQRFNSGDRE
eukprot:m.120766 g.120766  ORF g.120766 m.120766 type:complete len:752 (-) comp19598_c0_seq2:51-2306(-)